VNGGWSFPVMPALTALFLESEKRLVRKALRSPYRTGVALGMIAPRDPTQAQYARVENVSRWFRAHREPQQSTRFGPIRNTSFSRSKDGTFLMRLPSELGGTCALLAATSLRLTRMGALPDPT
jgi:hypothetical protein